jgi:nitrous-oxide reductase
MMNARGRPVVAILALVCAVVVLAQEQGPAAKPFSVTARRYRFEPARIEVSQDDVVTIELSSDDIAHSWTVDAYRIDKRATPGHPVKFEFRADKPGTFPIYCDLKTEDGCRQMKGELVVKPRK